MVSKAQEQILEEKTQEDFELEFDEQNLKQLRHDPSTQKTRYQAQSKIDKKYYDLVKYAVPDKGNESYLKEKANILRIIGLRHTNIVRYHALYIWEDTETNEDEGSEDAIIVFIKQDQTNANAFSLEVFFQNNKNLSQFDCFEKLNELYNALVYLKKEKNISHGNINPHTILIDPYNNWKLCDFHQEQANEKNSTTRTVNVIGSQLTRYYSPLKVMAVTNVLTTTVYNVEKDDVWAVGVLIARCLTGLDDEQIKELTQTEQKSKDKLKQIQGKLTGTYFPDLLQTMLEFDETKRDNLEKLGKKLETGIINIFENK